MSGWEYKVVPAPNKGVKAAGIKGPEGRFANAIEGLMNDMAAEGWEYLRAETLPSIERAGLTGSTTEWRNILVFRRAVAAPLDDFEPELLPPPAPASTAETAVPDAHATAKVAQEPQKDADDTQGTKADGAEITAKPMDDAQFDNGVEDTSDMADVATSLKNLAAQRNDVKSKD